MLSTLQMLRMFWCRSLQALPQSLGALSSLRTLVLYDSGLLALPEPLGKLPALEVLHLFKCRSLTALPASFSCLTSLRTLVVSKCQAGLAAAARQALPQLSVDG